MSTIENGDGQADKLNSNDIPLLVKPGEPISLTATLDDLANPDVDSIFYRQFEVEGLIKGSVAVHREQYMRTASEPSRIHTPAGSLNMEGATYMNDLEEVDKLTQPYNVVVYLQGVTPQLSESTSVTMVYTDPETNKEYRYRGTDSQYDEGDETTDISNPAIDQWAPEDSDEGFVFFPASRPDIFSNGNVHIIVDRENNEDATTQISS